MTMGRGNGVWTLHAGGAMVYHLNHRVLDEIDLYVEPRTACDDLIEGAMRLLAAFLPIHKHPEARQLFISQPSGNVKLHFEKVIFSFIITPNFSGTVQRISVYGHLPVASLNDAVGAKFMGMHNRDKLSDFVDIAAALRKGYTAADLIRAINAIRKQEVDHASIFRKMTHIPVEFQEYIAPVDRERLNKTGQAGLKLLSAT